MFQLHHMTISDDLIILYTMVCSMSTSGVYIWDYFLGEIMENATISLRRKNIGTNIKNIRLSLGLTLVEMSELFDPPASSSIVSKWERGATIPSPARLKKLAELSKTTVDSILTPATDELFLAQLNTIHEYYDMHKDDFEQDLSNFYLLKNLIIKYLSAGISKNQKAIVSLEEFFYLLDILLSKEYYAQFSKNPKKTYRKGKDELISILDDIFANHLGEITEKD